MESKTFYLGLDRWDTARATALPWAPDGSPILVIAPHPDDETLSVGGLIAMQRAMGEPVAVLAVTDGDAAYAADGDPRLAGLRRGEQEQALSVMGVSPGDRIRLGVPDGRVADHEEVIADRIASLGSARTMLVAPSTSDMHPDHEAAGRAALVAAKRLGCGVLSYMFWAWHHAEPSALHGKELVAVELSPTVHRRKQRALACHRTQLERWEDHDPVLPADLVVPATWSHEYFVVERP